MGGINYFKYLFHAIEVAGQAHRLALYFPSITTRDIREEFKGYVHRDYDAHGMIVGRLFAEAKSALNIRGEFESRLQDDGIRMLSHSGWLRAGSTVKTLGWLADCQHLALPQYFTNSELKSRGRGFRKTLNRCTSTIFSSEAARQEAYLEYGKCKFNTTVLNFYRESSFNESFYRNTSPPILKKYGIDRPFIYLPNQFWAHKNHRVVISALKIIKQKGLDLPLVICSGSTADRRNQDFFKELQEYISECKVGDALRVLGLIPFKDVQILMQSSAAVINPSLYEGWSSSVEEAKSLGKRVLLSRIPVHLEQAPDRGIFFEPHDPEQLSELLSQAAGEYSKETEISNMREAVTLAKQRTVSFGKNYLSMVDAHAL